MKLIFCVSIVLLSACRSSQPGELVGVDTTPSLEGPLWELKEFNGQAVNPDARKISLKLDYMDKSISGFGGCNKLMGTYALDGKKITFVLGTTKMTCPDQVDLESVFLKDISTVTGYKIKDSKLILLREKTAVASFVVHHSQGF